MKGGVRLPWNAGTFKRLFAILVGAAISGWAIDAVVIPQHFLSGGVSGISLLFYYLFGHPPVGLTILLLNIPIFILGWREVSFRFVFFSLIGMLGLSGAVTVFSGMTFPLHDNLLSALFAGILIGIGSGITFRAGGSQGGVDIISIFLNRRFSIRIGQTAFAINIVILIAAAVVIDLERALYTMVMMFVSSSIINRIQAGFNQRKTVMIISSSSRTIAQKILTDLGRGVTILKGEGGFSGAPRNVVYSVTTMIELGRLKALVWEIDPNAFIVVNDTVEVIGKGFKIQKSEDLPRKIRKPLPETARKESPGKTAK
jgi:uncharacterized membrane-anchored protein YitT (DUF2179 family)